MVDTVMTHTPQNPERRKTKKTGTLSPASVEFLQALRQDLERAMADYYDSLPADAAVEQARWGEFATDEFSATS